MDARCDGCGDGDHFNGHKGWVPYAMTWCCSETGQHYEPLGWLCQKCKTKNWQFKGRHFLNEELYVPGAPAVQATADADELAREICEAFDDPGYFTVKSIADIIRKAVSPKAAQEEDYG
jgi:hypothetical protein